MSPEAAAAARLEPAEIEVALVVDDEDRVRLDLEEARCRRDRAARLVHVRLRLEQRDAMAVEPDLCQAAVELRAPRPAVPARELVHHHPAGVVARLRVVAAGIAEPDDEQVERRGPLAPAPR